MLSLIGAAEINPGGTGLVCDDDELVLPRLRMVLEDAVYAVVSANNGREALWAAAINTAVPSQLLTDVSIPDIDERKLTRRIRHMYPDLKLLCLPAGASEPQMS
ncbi:MAG: response regulator [Fuerstiella sp.]|jgi:CheY-like chemotaxis protein|nr:response regulator [Fuerstiella sp.]